MKVFLLTAFLLILFTACEKESKTFSRWQLIELQFSGPTSIALDEKYPFSVKMDVQFISPSGKQYTMPAFYDGDGKGKTDGKIWKVRFSADENGTWNYRSHSGNRKLDGKEGSFRIKDPSTEAPAYYRWGRLEAVGTASDQICYLKFREGPFWLKAGCDDPENFLGKMNSYDTPEKRKAAIDYLASKGINSLYLITNNIDGDGKDVWPWLGKDGKEAKINSAGNVRFDVSRLEEWREIFEYMQQKGMVVYMVLEDDNAWKGYDHERYYREMIARFSYLPALIFNLNEEYNENYAKGEALELVRLIKEIDPFDHPCGIHNFNVPDEDYISAPQIDFTSVQTGNDRLGTGPSVDEYHKLVTGWIEKCRALQMRSLMVGIDEGRPEGDRKIWWSTFLSGGVWEAHVTAPYDRPMEAWDSIWVQLGGTRKFMESIPFWEMHPDSVTVKKGKAFCLSSGEGDYAFYLPEGRAVSLELPREKQYKASWWNPGNGADGKFISESVVQGGRITLSPPAAGDWALKIMAGIEPPAN